MNYTKLITTKNDDQTIVNLPVVTKICAPRWTYERIAHLGFLIGLGWNAKRISEDPIINSNINNIYRVVQRYGLSFRTATIMAVDLPSKVAKYFDVAALNRGLTREALIRHLLIEIASEQHLLDNILDEETK